MPPIRPVPAAIAPGLVAALCLAGCSNLNQSIGPGLADEPLLPVFAEADEAAPPPADHEVAPGPSLTHGQDRLGWPLHKVPVPVYRVQTNPAPDYRWLVLVDQTPRQKGRFPTPHSALNTTNNEALNYAEGATDYLAASGAIALSPVMMVLRDWSPAPRSPQHHFEMTPEERTEPLRRWFDVGPREDEGIGLTPEPPGADGAP